MKKNSRPPIPSKMEHYEKKRTMEQRCNWNETARNFTQFVKRILRKTGNDTRMDMSDPMVKRRIQAVADNADRIIDRYKHIKGLEYDHRDDTGEMWIELNFTPGTTYNLIEGHAYFLCAAAIWILDEVLADSSKRESLFQLLPEEEGVLDEVWKAMPDVWHAKYEYDLIQSVVYVLYTRDWDGDKIEMDDENTERVITNSTNATGNHSKDGPHWKAYEELMSLIPRESVERAVSGFESLFQLWTDRYFKCAASFQIDIRREVSRFNRLVDDFNAEREELIKAFDDMTRRPAAQPQKAQPAFNPLLANPFQGLGDPLKGVPISPGSFPMVPAGSGLMGTPMDKVAEIAMRMDDIQERYQKADEELSAAEKKMSDFTMELLRLGYIPQETCRQKYGDDVAKHMAPIRTNRPFEICFALIWLIDHGSDLPWLYGCGCGMMEEISESLPWGIIEYKERFDPVWSADEANEDEGEQISFIDDLPTKKTVKSAATPEWYERKYIPEEEGEFVFIRSLAQILYEETGCLIPRDMHQYDFRQKAIRKYGVPPKETSMLLQMFTALSNARRQDHAINLDEHLIKLWAEEDDTEDPEDETDAPENPELSYEELTGKLKQAQEENKKLRSSLHESEKVSREARKELADIRRSAELDRRELADLRELVFNLENEEERGEEVASVDESAFPYEVRKETVIFGGHETWLKAIRPMLTGSVRFIDKDLNFNVNIIRKAEMVWIQPNALSHSQYYRIVDAARQYKKPVRYFTYASASKGAMQVMKADQ